jgi:plasmid stability protein
MPGQLAPGAWLRLSPHPLGASVAAVPSIQVKDVPDDVHAALRRHAALAGQSLQEYLLATLTRHALTPSLDEVLAAAGGRAGGSLPLTAATLVARAGRGPLP